MIFVQVQKLNEELQAADAAAEDRSCTSQHLFTTAPDTINAFSMSSFQSPVIASSDQITAQSSTAAAVEYQMLMPLAATAAGGAGSVPQVAAAVSGATPIIVGISLPTVDSVATYQTFQPFDLQNARLVL